jgi:hypothetical protein
VAIWKIDELVHQQHKIEGIDRSQPLHRQREQHQRAYSERGVACLQDALARNPVRGVAGEQEKHNARQELSQTHQAKIERTMADPVHLPGHGDRLHL